MIIVHWNSPHLTTSQMLLVNHKLDPENTADPIRLQEESKNYTLVYMYLEQKSIGALCISSTNTAV